RSGQGERVAPALPRWSPPPRHAPPLPSRVSRSPLSGLLHYLLYFGQSPILHRRPSFSCLSPHLAAAGFMLGIHFRALGDVRAEHRAQRLDITRKGRIEDLLVLAARLVAREILHPKRQHAVAQALVVHLAMEVQEPARIAA